MSRKGAMVVAAALSAMIVAGAAAAKPQGKWDPVTSGGEQSLVSPIGLYRTPDQVLHVAWQRRTGGSSYDLLHTGIDASGRLRAPTPIVTGWIGILDAALTQYFPAPGSNDDMVELHERVSARARTMTARRSRLTGSSSRVGFSRSAPGTSPP